MSRFLSGLVKTALGVGVVYAAYKIGEDRGKKGKEEELNAQRNDLLMEIELVEDMIKDYDNIPHKTQSELDNKRFLEIKLEHLKRKL
jgi:hypothetical protein